MGYKRAFYRAEMRAKLREGWDFDHFYEWSTTEGIAEDYDSMARDWAEIQSVDEARGKLRYVARNKYPSDAIVGKADLRVAEDWIYHVKATWLREGEAEEESDFVTIRSDKALTRGEVEDAFWEAADSWGDRSGMRFTAVTPWTAIRRA